MASGDYGGLEDPAAAVTLERELEGLIEDPALNSGARAELEGVLVQLRDFPRKGKVDRMAVVALAQRLVLSLTLEPETSSRRRPPARGRSASATRTGAASKREPTLADLSGVGPSTVAKLMEKGIATVEDLAHWLPVDYHDRRSRPRLDQVTDGDVVVIEGEVVSFRRGFRGRGRIMVTMVFRPAQEDDTVEVRWFHHVGGLAQKAVAGARLVLIGAVRRYRGRFSMVHPEVREPGAPGPAIAVRYPTVEGIGQSSFARWCHGAVALMKRAHPERSHLLPADLIRDEHLVPDYYDALLALHAPREDLGTEDLAALQRRHSPAHRRVAFERLFFVQMALLRQREQWRNSPCLWSGLGRGVARERLRSVLPFEPTRAQWRVLEEVEQDLSSGRPMLRLLQGDVGSGKTVIAFGAACSVGAGGGQTAIMAPTEVLARQHHQTLAPWCEKAGLRVGLVTGSMPRAQRTTLLSLVEAGRIDILVGTHALLVQDVRFRRLGLVVVDEQHRFGVEQRARLRAKGGAPHLLVMTATPIPRTLALTAHGDLDLSILDELPPGREPVETRVFAGRKGLERARATLCSVVEAGAQAFVVCPLVEASNVLDVSDVEATARALAQRIPNVAIGVVHGRMSTEDKAAVMDRFRSGEIRILVATTVIEVGVDVAGAQAILIEHAERFGLAQLHQLRGRVGRRDQRALCLAHTASAPTSEAARRLAILRDTQDGFALAEHDLTLRGPGDVFGTRQTGAASLVFDPRWIVAARAAAARILDGDPDLERAPLLRTELERRGIERPYAAEAG